MKINKLNLAITLSFVYLIVMTISGCVIGRDVSIGDTYPTRQEILDRSPILGDTTSAVDDAFDLSNGALDTLVQYQDYLYEVRQQSFEYPRKGGGIYVIKYYEGNVIYAAIINPESITLEDIVFFKEKWYYNQKKITEEITGRQATIFVENILEMIQKEENEDVDLSVTPDTTINN